MLTTSSAIVSAKSNLGRQLRTCDAVLNYAEGRWGQLLDKAGDDFDGTRSVSWDATETKEFAELGLILKGLGDHRSPLWPCTCPRVFIGGPRSLRLLPTPPPFSAEQYRSLLWLRGRITARITARIWLADHKQYEDDLRADARLSFAKWLYITGRLNEGMP